MSKKVFGLVGLVVAGFLLVTGLGLMPSPASAQFTINPNQPNCFSSESIGYVVTDCAIHAIFVGKPLEPGKCYVSSANMSVSISATEVSCDTINSKTQADNDAKQKVAQDDLTAEEKAKASFTSRNDAVNCNGANPDGSVNQAALAKCIEENPLIQQFSDIITFLTIGVSVIITIVVIIGGFQYMTARNNPQAVASAKKKVAAALIAFVAYMLLWAFLQYLLPGGII